MKEIVDLKKAFEDKIKKMEADVKQQIVDATSIKSTGAKNALYDGIKNMIKKKIGDAT